MKILEQQKEILKTLKTKEIPKQETAVATEVFLIPKWQTLAPTYGEALQIVLNKIKETRPFYNWREDKLGPNYLRESEEKKAAFAKLKDEDGYYTITAQMGYEWRGKSVEEVRNLYTEGEFGLGAFEVASILLTHPEILTKYEDLWIDCPGDEFASGAHGGFSDAPFLSWCGGGLRFGGSYVGIAYEQCGSASAFLPQQ